MSTFVVDTSRSPHAKLHPVPIENVHLEDTFWAPRLRTLREVTIPSQHKLCEETGRIFNFRRAAGKEKGSFQGLRFNDSDVYKWIEAASFTLASMHDQKLHDLVRQLIAQIVAAQDEDGYLNTHFTLDHKKDRWKNLRDNHELYCAGHLIQAAVAFYRATGESLLLEAACRFADHITSLFSQDRRPCTPGHPEIEMALVELYRLTRNEKYLRLAKFFIDNRGKGVIGGSPYHIDHEPFQGLTKIVGHAVRALYLNCGAADVYMETGEKSLWNAPTRLWHSMTKRKMYVTGGAGSRHQGEAFGDDYELPNARAYAETCAAVANVMWNWRMLLISGEARFADVMELALYNGALAGIALDGKHYFYVNPLADRALHRRQSWFNCSCCPPNIARLLASLPGYFYSVSDGGIWVHFYAQSTAHIEFGGSSVTVLQCTNYPWDGEIEIVLHLEKEKPFSLYMRIPGWCRKAEVQVNDEMLRRPIHRGNYVEVRRSWRDGDEVHLSLSMPVERMVCHPRVIENNDRVALNRGPIIYCVEQADNPDSDVWSLVLPADVPLEVEWAPDLLNGVTIIQGEALALDADQFEGNMYQPLVDATSMLRRVEFTAIPYYGWANRETGPMTVWIRSSGHLPSY